VCVCVCVSVFSVCVFMGFAPDFSKMIMMMMIICTSSAAICYVYITYQNLKGPHNPQHVTLQSVCAVYQISSV